MSNKPRASVVGWSKSMNRNPDEFVHSDPTALIRRQDEAVPEPEPEEKPVALSAPAIALRVADFEPAPIRSRTPAVPKSQFTFKLPVTVHNRLRKVSTLLERNMDEIATEAIELHLKKLIDEMPKEVLL